MGFFFVFLFLLASDLISSGCNHAVCSFTRSRKRLARDVCDTLAAHSGLVDDITDTDCSTTKRQCRALAKSHHVCALV